MKRASHSVASAGADVNPSGSGRPANRLMVWLRAFVDDERAEAFASVYRIGCLLAAAIAVAAVSRL